MLKHWLASSGVIYLLVGSSHAQTTTLVDLSSSGVQAFGECYAPSASADGRYVAFSGGFNLFPGSGDDISIRDRQSGVTTSASISSAGVLSNGASTRPSMSADGRFVAFESFGNNLVPGDTNSTVDIFVHDRQGATTVRASTDSAGQQANSSSGAPSLSGDGRYVAFQSGASNLVAGDTNSVQDVFVKDLLTGLTTIVSVGSSGIQGNASSSAPAISANGRYVAFFSSATNLVPSDLNGVGDIFVRDLQSGTTVRASISTVGVESNGTSGYAAMSTDGRFIAFYSTGSTLVPGDTNGVGDIFIRDLQLGVTTRVSVDSAGTQANAAFTPFPAGGAGYHLLSISGSGRYVAFASSATNLVPGDLNASDDVFLRDVLLGTTTRVSVSLTGAEGNGYSTGPSISADGRFVAFESEANDLVVPVDVNSLPLAFDIFMRDRGPASTYSTLCAGDGTDSPCPCANTGLSSRGCNNSAGSGGASITASGLASISLDSLVLTVGSAVPQGPGLYFDGMALANPTAPFGVPFGNGLRCVGGTTHRLEVRTADASGASSTTVSLHVFGAAVAGATRYYQLWYRDTPNFGTCTGGFNMSAALGLTWMP